MISCRFESVTTLAPIINWLDPPRPLTVTFPQTENVIQFASLRFISKIVHISKIVRTVWSQLFASGWSWISGKAGSGLKRILYGVLFKETAESMDRCTGSHYITKIVVIGVKHCKASLPILPVDSFSISNIKILSTDKNFISPCKSHKARPQNIMW